MDEEGAGLLSLRVNRRGKGRAAALWVVEVDRASTKVGWWRATSGHKETDVGEWANERGGWLIGAEYRD